MNRIFKLHHQFLLIEFNFINIGDYGHGYGDEFSGYGYGCGLLSKIDVIRIISISGNLNE